MHARSSIRLKRKYLWNLIISDSNKDAICIESILSHKTPILIMRPIDPVIDKLLLVLQYAREAAFHATDVIYE